MDEQWPECVERWRGYASNAPRSWSGQVVRRHVVGRESQLRKMVDTARDCLEWLATAQPPAVCASAEVIDAHKERWTMANRELDGMDLTIQSGMALPGGMPGNIHLSNGGRVLFTILPSGEVELGEGVTVNEAAERFYRALGLRRTEPAVCASAEVVEAVRAWQAIGLSDDKSLLGDMEGAQDFMLPLLLEAALRTEADVRAEERERCAQLCERRARASAQSRNTARPAAYWQAADDIRALPAREEE